MKRTLWLTTLALLSTLNLRAEPIDSKVIHNYTFIGAGYQYAEGDNGPDGHGGGGVISYDYNNFLFSLGGGYLTAGDSPKFEVMSVSGSVGYVFRLQENHLNIVPHFGLGFSENQITFGPFSSDSDTTALLPGISLSYAFNDRFSVNASYGYSYDIDRDTDGNSVSLGAELAVTENVGVDISAHFVEEQGFTGATAGISFHF